MLNQSKRSEWLSFVVIVFNPQVVKMATFEINSTCMRSLNAIKQKLICFLSSKLSCLVLTWENKIIII